MKQCSKHQCPAFYSNGQCVDCAHEYYLANRDKILARSKSRKARGRSARAQSGTLRNPRTPALPAAALGGGETKAGDPIE